MFNRLLALLFLAAVPLNAQTVIQGGSVVSNGSVLNVAANTPITVMLTPPNVSIGVGNTQGFTATLGNDLLAAGVNWTISGVSCSPTTNCGVVAPTFSRSGQTVTFTAAASLPSNPSVVITATSVQDPTKFATATITLTSTPPQSPVVGQFVTTTPKQPGANSLTFPAPTMVGDTPIIAVTAQDGSNFTGIVDQLGRSFTDIGCQGDAVGIGHAAMFYMVGNHNPITSVVVTSTGTVGGNVDIGFLDATTGNTSQPDNHICNGSSTPTTDPQGPVLTTFSQNDLVVSTISVGGDVLGVNAPFTFGSLDRGDGMSWAIIPTLGVFGPHWSTTNFGFIGATAAFRVGAQPNAISVSLAPTSATVQTNNTQNFTVTLVNDNTHAGATVALSGVGCSGATCGNASQIAVASATQDLSGFSAATSMTVTAGHANLGNGVVLTLNTASNLMIFGTTASTDKGDACVVTPTATDTGGGTSNAIVRCIPATVGAQSITVTATNPFGAVGAYWYDLNISPTTATFLTTQQVNGGSTTNPVGPAINPTGAGLIIGVISPAAGNGVLSIAAPFTQPVAKAFSSYYFNPTSGSVSPSWTTSAGTWASTLLSIVPITTLQSGGTFVYTAPSGVPTPPTVTITATSVADGTKTGTATVTLTGSATVGISVSPPSINLSAGGSANATATITNAGNNQVSWVVSGPNCNGTACGTISSSTSTSGGAITYSAPASVNSTLSVNLTASSVADPTKTATIPITVNPAVIPPPGCGGSGCPAFPGAEGGGAIGQGGRGGVAIEVTNFNSSGVGSLSACISATGPRRCIFRVAGLFPGGLRADNPFLDIDGQSAPGEVILGGPNTPGDVFRISTHDVTVRYVTASPDNRQVLSGPQGGTSGFVLINCAAVNNQIGTGGCFGLILDHVTARWAGNKNIAVFSNFTPQAPDCQSACNGPNRNITISWFLQYEPHVGHPVGIGNGTDESGTGSVSQLTFEVEQDWINGLLAQTSHRIPEGPMMRNRWENMLVYNWSFFSMASLGTQFLDVINSKWKAGNLNVAGPANVKPIHISDCSAQSALSCSITPSVFLSGNIGPGQTTPPSDQFSLADQIVCENCDGVGPVPSNWRRTTPISIALKFPITPIPAVNLDAAILPTVGNSRHVDCNGNWATHRDAADSRIITRYQNGSPGGFWPNDSYPPIQNQTSPNQIPVPTTDWTDIPITSGFQTCTESLHDGIPDAWKTLHGFSTSDAGLANRVDPNNGFTYVEVYLGVITP